MTGEDDRRTTDSVDHRALWVWTASELVALVAVLGLVLASLLGEPTPLSGVPRRLRLAAAAFLVVELLIPAWVFLDVRRRPGIRGHFWVHVAAMPGINLFGLVAYLEDRRQARRA